MEAQWRLLRHLFQLRLGLVLCGLEFRTQSPWHATVGGMLLFPLPKGLPCDNVG